MGEKGKQKNRCSTLFDRPMQVWYDGGKQTAPGLVRAVALFADL
jgi:hypothetical protein